MLKYFITAVFLLGCLPTFASIKNISLEDGLKQALEKSREVKASEAGLSASDSEISKADSGYFPTLDFYGTTGTYHDRMPLPGDTTIPTTPRDHNTYEMRVEAKQVLFSGFSTVATVQSAKAAKTISDRKLEASRQSVRNDFISTYFAIQMVRRKLAVENQVLELRKARFNQVQSRHRQGRATDLEELQAELAVQSQEPAINSLKALLENHSLHFNRILGSDVTDQYQLTDDLESAARRLDSAQTESLERAFERAVVSNADLMRLEAESEKTNADLKLEDAKNLPNVSVRAFGGVDAYLQNEIGTQNSSVYGVLLELDAPLFSGLSTIYTSQVKRSRLQELTERRSHAREDLLEHLQQTYRKVETNRENVKAAELSVKISRQVASRADSLYSAGRATLIDVLDAYAKLLNSEEALTDHFFTSIETITQLKTIIGD